MSFRSFDTTDIAAEGAVAHPDAIARAVEILRSGGLVALPTETVYGLGADARNPEAIARLYAVKGRPLGHPVIVHLSSAEMLSGWVRELPPAAQKLANAFWPGPLTLILPRAVGVPDAVTGGQDTVGLRVPAHPVALALLKAFGGGIAAPSANRFGRISPTTAAHVRTDLGTEVDCILDGGACPVGVESTIVAFPEGRPVILRPGMITEAQIANVLADRVTVGEAASPTAAESLIRAPGRLASHYAPNTPLAIVPVESLEARVRQACDEIAPSRTEGKAVQAGRIGVMARCSPPASLMNHPAVVWIMMPSSSDAYARELYATLRALDARGLSEIFAEALPEEAAWTAIQDRLSRAACRN